MKASRLAHFRALLEGERDRIVALLHEGRAIPAVVAAAAPGEESTPGIAGAASVDDAALMARESESLADVQRALRLLRDHPDRFGICIECGTPIADARLELVPTARLCARHAGVSRRPGAHPTIAP